MKRVFFFAQLTVWPFFLFLSMSAKLFLAKEHFPLCLDEFLIVIHFAHLTLVRKHNCNCRFCFCLILPLMIFFFFHVGCMLEAQKPPVQGEW